MMMLRLPAKQDRSRLHCVIETYVDHAASRLIPTDFNPLLLSNTMDDTQDVDLVACVMVTRTMIAADYMDVHGVPHPLFGDVKLSTSCQASEQFCWWNECDPNLAVIKSVNLNDPVAEAHVLPKSLRKPSEGHENLP
jgi:hypothetical protein